MIDIKQGYKKTDVGIIPEDWEVKELGDICYPSKDRINPITNKQNYKCIELEHLSQGSGMLLGYTKSNELLSQKSLFEKGDVLFGKLRPYLRKYLLADFDGVCTTEIWVLKTEKNISNQYLFHLVQSEKIIEAANISTGTKMPRAEWKTVSETKIPLPTKAEQTAIATALSDADALISSLEKLITKKRNIKQGAMQKLLQPKEGWEVKTVGEISKVGRGRVISHKEIVLAIEKRYPVYSSQTTNNGVMGNIDTYDFDGEYVTWTTDGENAGTVFYRNGKFNCTNVCGTIKLIKDNALFVSMLLGNTTSKYVSRNLANPKLMNDPMKKIEISLPPLKEQTRIGTILSDMDAEIQALEIKLEKYKNIKLGMMQNLLTGKIRLI